MLGLLAVHGWGVYLLGDPTVASIYHTLWYMVGGFALVVLGFLIAPPGPWLRGSDQPAVENA